MSSNSALGRIAQRMLQLVMVSTVLYLAGCGGHSSPVHATSSSPALESLKVTPGSASAALGQTVQLKATGSFTNGANQDFTSTVVWRSLSPEVASVNSVGVVSAVGTGTAILTASQASLTAEMTIVVSNAALQSVAITPSTSSIAAGQTTQFTATGTYSDKTTQDLTQLVQWSAAQPGIATVSSTGLAVAKAAGSTSVTASLSGTNSSALVTVAPAVLVTMVVHYTDSSVQVGATEQFTATGTYSDGSSADLTKTVVWTSSPAGILSFGSSGVATAKAAGTATVVASSGGSNAVSGTGTLAVTAAPVTPPPVTPPPVTTPSLLSISISPAGPAVLLGSSLQLTVTGVFTDGSTQDLTSQATWNVDQSSVAAISATSLATGLQVGTTGIEVSAGGAQASETFTVQPLMEVGYFDASSHSDTTLRATNVTGTGQNICAMLYLFDQDQQMSECCGCMISADGLLSLSLNSNLLNNPLTGVISQKGTVMIVPSDPSNNPTCNAGTLSPAGVTLGWSTHLQPDGSGKYTSTEEPLSVSPLSPTLSSGLQAQCTFVQQLGSGQGICTCGSTKP